MLRTSPQLLKSNIYRSFIRLCLLFPCISYFSISQPSVDVQLHLPACLHELEAKRRRKEPERSSWTGILQLRYCSLPEIKKNSTREIKTSDKICKLYRKKNFFLQLKDLTISSFCLCCRFVVVSLNNGHKVDFSSRVASSWPRSERGRASKKQGIVQDKDQQGLYDERKGKKKDKR